MSHAFKQDHYPLLSVIVPVYNVEVYLEKCINSILSQDFSSFELILVDDGSLDESGLICDRYANYDERVKVIHKTNGGLPSARRAGVQSAHGKWIGFVDSDDWIESNMYSTMMEDVLQHEDVDICFTGIILHKNGIVSYPRQEKNERIYKKREALLHYFLGAGGEEPESVPTTFCTLVCKKNLLMYPDVFSDSIIYWEDFYGVWKLLIRADKIHYIPYRGYHYCKRDGNLTSQRFCTKKLTYITVPIMMDHWIKTVFADDEFGLKLKKIIAEIVYKNLCRYILVMASERGYQKQIEYYQNYLSQYKDQLGRNLSLKEKQVYDLVNLPFQEMMLSLERCRNQLTLDIKSMRDSVDKLYIYGAGEIGTEIAELCDRENIQYEGFVISYSQNVDTIYRDKPVISFMDLKKKVSDEIGVLLALDEHNVKQVILNVENSGIRYKNVGKHSLKFLC